MAEGKKSFILYANQWLMVKHLSDEQAGQLFKQIMSYVNDENPVDPNDVTVLLVWENIKATLKSDLKAFEEKCKKNKENITNYWQNKKNTNEYERNTNVYERNTNDIRMYSDNDNDSNKSDKSLYDTISKKESICINNTYTKEKDFESQFDIALKDFINMRTRIKKPLTSLAKTRLLNKLEELSKGDENLKIAILNQSVDNCWQGIFALKEEAKIKSISKDKDII